MQNDGGRSETDAGGAHGAGATHGRPSGGTQHAPQQAPDAAAGGTTGEGSTPSVTKLNLNRGSTLQNNTWDALQHRFDNNWSLFPEKTLLYWGTVTPRFLSLSVTL